LESNQNNFRSPRTEGRGARSGTASPGIAWILSWSGRSQSALQIVIERRFLAAGLDRVDDPRLAHELFVGAGDRLQLGRGLRQRLADLQADARAEPLAEHVVHPPDINDVGIEAQKDRLGFP